MELLFLASAFFLGFLALRCKLPPMIGFLIAGFILRLLGFSASPLLESIADLGVTLLLFTIGLKLDIKLLLKRSVWAGATAHNLLSSLFFLAALFALQKMGITILAPLVFSELLLLGFALSFSSTVFAVKVLQEKGELNATYGAIAIAFLVMQDVFAVIFLTASTGKVPEIYALALFALPLLRPFFYYLLDRCGHGEMLVLSGIVFALLFGAGLFEFVGLKADLGALVFGMLLAGHSKASELSKSLFNIKELLLVCFFLNIGLAEAPTLQAIGFASLLILLLPFKAALYFVILRYSRFRLRTATLGTLALCNYSEFGLIVGGLAYKLGWLPGNLLAAIAIAVSFSFILAAPMNDIGHLIYQKTSRWFTEHTANTLNPDDRLIDFGTARVLILGMGRIGTGAYDELMPAYNGQLLGIDTRVETVAHHQRQQRNVMMGDAIDTDFWARVVSKQQVELILLAMPHSHANMRALKQITRSQYRGKIAAIAKYADEVEQLLDNGADVALNIYREAGSGFARHVTQELSSPTP
ncbi:cation:proton antiporter [Thaumasiovibrio sp. DFM-14]|uniref:cation:proton antiporter domain-containing protein n=1 Tax=Thaumasiovibrio sp. DFM-14 TaxID=3384792 RepID=UPI00399FAD30